MSLTWGTVLCPLARHFILCLVMFQPRKTRPDQGPDLTEKLLTIIKNKCSRREKQTTFSGGAQKSDLNETILLSTVNVLKLRTLNIIIFPAVRNFRNYVCEINASVRNFRMRALS